MLCCVCLFDLDFDFALSVERKHQLWIIDKTPRNMSDLSDLSDMMNLTRSMTSNSLEWIDNDYCSCCMNVNQKFSLSIVCTMRGKNEDLH